MVFGMFFLVRFGLGFVWNVFVVLFLRFFVLGVVIMFGGVM